MQRKTRLKTNQSRISRDLRFQNLIQIVEINQPGGRAGEIRRRMAKARDTDAFATSPRQGDDLLQLGHGTGLEVQFGPREERLRPRVV